MRRLPCLYLVLADRDSLDSLSYHASLVRFRACNGRTRAGWECKQTQTSNQANQQADNELPARKWCACTKKKKKKTSGWQCYIRPQLVNIPQLWPPENHSLATCTPTVQIPPNHATFDKLRTHFLSDPLTILSSCHDVSNIHFLFLPLESIVSKRRQALGPQPIISIMVHVFWKGLAVCLQWREVDASLTIFIGPIS